MKYIITEDQANKLKEGKWSNPIKEIVLSMGLKSVCEIYVKSFEVMRSNELKTEYLVIIKANMGFNTETKIREKINEYLPMIGVIVTSIPCKSETNI